MFQMENHNGMFFTIWYGVYNRLERTLVYSSGGHHPLCRDAGPQAIHAADPRRAPSSAYRKTSSYKEADIRIPLRQLLHVFTGDGVFEISDRQGGSSV
jgi:sigma-B regulation protein RsbU (phosphoserine phosphatase)